MLQRRNIGVNVRAACVFLFIISCALAAAADKPGNLSLTFSGREVTVAGIEKGHRVVVFGVGIGRHGNYPLLTREAKVLTDDDGDGKATATFYQVPSLSVFVTVDAETGRYAVVTPTGATPRPLEMPGGSWRGSHTHVDVRRRFIESLVVRPRSAAWWQSIAEGGPNDGDGVNNGLSRLSLEKMKILSGEAKGPGFVIPRDLIVIIDPFTLDTFISEAQ